MNQQELLDLIAFEPDNEFAIHELIEQMPGETDDDRLRQAAMLVDGYNPLSEANLTAAMHENDGSVSGAMIELIRRQGGKKFTNTGQSASGVTVWIDETNTFAVECKECKRLVSNRFHLTKHKPTNYGKTI